jgi:hypothetical protein
MFQVKTGAASKWQEDVASPRLVGSAILEAPPNI